MNPDTAKIIDRLVLSRDGLRKLDIADYAMIRDAREAMADAANALTNYAKTFSVIEQNDQAAAPHMLPAPEGVSEAEKALHDLCSWLDQWDRRDNDTAKNIRTVLSALSSERERAERAEKERDEARAGMAYILDRAEYGDSYGVPGSSFTACHFCQGGGAPGAEMIHDPSCPVAEYPSAVSEWFAEMTDAEARAQAAEAKVKEGAELLDAFGRMLNEDHDNLPDELVVSLTYDDTDYDDDLGGPNTLLGELFLRVFRNARSAALRWTEEASQGEGE